MKRYVSILLFLALAAFVCHQSVLKTKSEVPYFEDCDYFVEVIAVSDGDTFTGITEDKEKVRFRIQGIDAPELSQAFSRKSKDYLATLIHGKRVCIKVQKERDGFGRPVVYIFTPDNLDVGAEMIKAGMAWHFKKYDDSDYYAKLEEEAREKKVGLWGDLHPVAPWVYRAH
ncbi:MAG: thermonuclease family protein [Bacteroidota bacterium]|jgi:endonuclease YncB( thermonuclease family)|nr:thermonuclease family protein [Bacteroidota bacterium]HHU96986.1 nuclease [Petrimonas sp.]